MLIRALLSMALAFCAAPLRADSDFISDAYEHARFDDAISRIKGNPDRFVMVYLGANARACAPCGYTRRLINTSDVVSKLKSQVVVAEAHAWYPNGDYEIALVKKFGEAHWRVSSVAPVLTIVDHEQTSVLRLVGGLNDHREALLVADFLAGKHYTRTSFREFVANSK